MASKKTFTEELKRLIADSGETRYRIWQATGIDQATLSRFMNGKAGLSLENLDVLTEYLGLEIVKKATPANRRTSKGT